MNYPADRLTIMPLNDRSTDTTRHIIDYLQPGFPNVSARPPAHTLTPGKAAALKWAMEFVDTPLLLVFDADYVPGRGLIRQLLCCFSILRLVRAGCVVPLNVSAAPC